MTDTARLVTGPTFEEMLHPDRIPATLRARAIAAQQNAPLDPLNLYNITWRDAGNRPYYDLLPPALTGVEAPIIVLYGRDFPTGSHKVGAAYSVALERELAGDLQPGVHTCVWPSTGNYGIGGAWVGGRLGLASIVVLPQNMSAERFELLRHYGARIITTSGGESNVREVYAACAQLRCEDANCRVLNQFESFGNYRFHYYVTGNTVVELTADLQQQGIGHGRVAAFVSAMGSAGTIAAGDRIKQVWSEARVVGLEPMQCPTLFCNGYGSHSVQGIGDSHVAWIHNVLNMDALMAVDDQECLQGLRLLNDRVGWETMIARYGVPEESLRRMSSYVGISGVCNILGAIKAAKYYGLGRDDLIITICTDTGDRYRSVLAQMAARYGPLDEVEAAVRLVSIFHKQKTDWVREGTREARSAWHALKYFSWVEQLGKSIRELDAQRSPEFWSAEQDKVAEVDQRLLAYRNS